MTAILVQYDHVTLHDRYPTEREVPWVPRAGDSVELFGTSWMVYRVHWWDSPAPGAPAARIVLRTPDEYRRLLAWRDCTS